MHPMIQKAIDLFNEHSDLLDPTYYENTSEESIEKSEETLGVVFPQDFRDYLKYFGKLDFEAEEFYGIINDDVENGNYGSLVKENLENRRDYQLPDYVMSVYSNGFGEDYCLNYKQVNESGEPKITVFPLGSDDYYPHEELYDSFGEFLVDMIENELRLADEIDDAEIMAWLEQKNNN